MKRTLIIGTLILSLGFGQSVSAAATNGKVDFKDVGGHWAKSNIEYMVEQGAVDGYPDGTFRPEGTITRAEFSKVLADLMDADGGSNAFADTKGHWAESKVNGLVNEGIIVKSEYPNGFAPDTKITRLEISKMVARGLAQESLLWKAVLLGFQQLPAINVPFNDQDEMKLSDVPYIALANSSDIINGYDDGTFKIDRSATRAEATVMLKRYLDAKSKKPVLSELLEKFKGEQDVQKFSKSQLEAWVDKDADIKRLANLPINHYTGTSLAKNHDALIYPMGHDSSTNDTELVTQAMNDMIGWMNVYENLDYRTVGDSWKNKMLRYYSQSSTYHGVHYSNEDLPKLIDVYVKEVKDGKYIQESFFVTDLSLAFKQKRTEYSNNEFVIRGTQYVRFTSVTDLPEGVELNKWYKRDVDVKYMQNLWGDKVSWDTADNIAAGYTVITPYKLVTVK
ncbi:S-layer homology domain-containing protein [Paenibacillus sedimenti]|uniref:S-layer homology domain-containing protein n=1 Tax=Paenibacillus sedimenti TaxID=2770274 RepID=A0A926KTJ5_9BACL|nr:S-layer homology domain-containing protein [Paenibacillus sedimenti]MBD0383869.1 S-layer homology domain-containing protein [Paenibacillus sedimenti]